MLVTKDDYFKSRGIDLTKELNGSTDNPSAEVNLFLINQEIWLKNYIELNFEPCGIDNEDFINNKIKERLNGKKNEKEFELWSAHKDI